MIAMPGPEPGHATVRSPARARAASGAARSRKMLLLLPTLPCSLLWRVLCNAGVRAAGRAATTCRAQAAVFRSSEFWAFMCTEFLGLADVP
eukprot:SAG22_NODE_13863_length_392_cov_1.211604_1_plen_90_part_10